MQNHDARPGAGPVSVILSWENPPETFNPIVRRVEVRGGSEQVLSADAPWGLFEDLADVGPYTVYYMTANDSAAAVITHNELRIYPRPLNTCKITFNLLTPAGAPDSARTIQISNNQNYLARILTNQNGYAEFFAVHGARLIFAVQDNFLALDVAIPALGEIDWLNLRHYGSAVRADGRGLLG